MIWSVVDRETALGRAIAFRQFNYEGDDGLAKGGVLDANESSMKTQSLLRQGKRSPFSMERPFFAVKTEEVDWPYAQRLRKAE